MKEYDVDAVEGRDKECSKLKPILYCILSL